MGTAAQPQQSSGLVAPNGSPIRSGATAGVTPRLLLPSDKPAMPVVVRDASGTPVPPSEIVARLKQWEPSLGLKYHAMQWAFTWTWKEHDPRRGRIRSGEYSPDDAYDIIGYLPLDCTVDEAPAYAVECLKQYPRDEVRKLVDGVARYNHVETPRQQVEQLVADTMNDLHKNPDLKHTTAANRVSVLADVTG